MSERVDHAAEARQWNETASGVGLTMVETSAFAAVAQVHAVLALVEQQRIANLIALGMYRNADGSRLAQHAVAHPVDEYSVAINDEIKEALGLT